MYKFKAKAKTTIASNHSVEGETMEMKIERLLNNNDTNTESKELIYTRAEDGIVAAFNIRHDHWDDAYEQASTMAEKRTELDAERGKKRKEVLKQKEEEDKFLREQAKKGLNPKPDEEV